MINTMKRKSILLMALVVCTGLGAHIRVVSDQTVGNGFYPRFQDAATLTVIDEENADYEDSTPSTGLAVDNEDLCLNLYRDGVRTILTPDGSDVNYIWSSLSPDGTMILYNTRKGTSVCDLNGRKLYSLGHLNAPVWYGNAHVVGMHDKSDGHRFTGSSIALYALATGVETELVPADKFAMYPTVNAKYGRVAYNTLEGKVHLAQLTLTDEPIVPIQPRLVKAGARNIRRQRLPQAGNMNPSDLKIYINPGHGGHWSNDRNMTIYPFASGDVNGFWESNSNLDKGLALDSMLRELGVQTKMSRRTNNDGGGNDADLLETKLKQGTITKAQYDDMLANGDDRALSAIVAESNAWKPNFMISIHSNAGGPSNYVLELYAGVDPDDTYTYPTPTPCSDESRAVVTVIGNQLQSNTLTPWTTSSPMIRGDKSFGRTAMHWSDGYGVLRRLTSAGTISEGSMHDYIPETYRLMNIDYRRKEAWYFTKSFMNYYCGRQLAAGVIGGQLRDANNKQLFPDIVRQRKTNDELDPLCGATVELLQGGEVIKTYTTDELYNGLFYFFNLVPGTYTLRASKEHYYTQERVVVVTADNLLCETMLMNMCRETRPEVISYSPHPAQLTDSVEVSEKIVFNFNWDMLEEPTQQAFSISPEVAGTIEFSNSQKTMTFTPAESLDPGVEYTVTLASTACHPDTNYVNTLAEDFVFKFRTRNRAGLQLVQAYPANGATDVSLNPTIMLVFDAQLAGTAKSQAGNEFEITDGKGFSFKPTSRQFTANSVSAPYGSGRFEVNTALQPNTAYTLIIKQALADLNGVHVLNPIEVKFTTGTGVEPAPEGEIINALDSLFFVMNADKSANVSKKSIMLNTTKSVQGSASNKVSYTFADVAEASELYLEPKEFYFFRSDNGFGMDVYGDLSYNEIYLDLVTDGDMRTVLLGTLDYVGWKHLRVALDALPESVDFQLQGIRIVRSDNVLSGAGELYLDRMMRFVVEPTDLRTSKIHDFNSKYIRHGRLMIKSDNRLFNAKGQQL